MTTRPRSASGGAAVMRDRAWLDFIRDRVLAEIRANPSQHPYLGEERVGHRPRRETCDRGHQLTGDGTKRRCLECRRLRQRARRSAGRERTDDVRM